MGAAEDRVQRRTAELAQTNAELERSNRDLRQFAYVTSHDLREPLRAISGYCGLLKEQYGGKLDAVADEFIEFAVQGALRVIRQLDGLLEYSRVGTHGACPEPVDSKIILEESLLNLWLAIDESGAHFDMKPF